MIPSRITRLLRRSCVSYASFWPQQHTVRAIARRSRESSRIRRGAVVVGATVTLSNINTGIKVVRNTSETGLFLFDLVDPGAYSVTIEATGLHQVHSGKHPGSNARRHYRQCEPAARRDRGEHHRNRYSGGGTVQFRQPRSDHRLEACGGDAALRSQSVQADAARALGREHPRRDDAVPFLGCQQRGSGRRHQPEERSSGGRQPDRHRPQEQLSAEHRRRSGSGRLDQQRGRGVRTQRRRSDQHDAEVGHE